MARWSTGDIADLYRSRQGTCLIVGNGPSLADIPTSFLHSFPSFACNRIWERKDFNYDFYFACDSWVPDENLEQFLNVTAPVFLLAPDLDEWIADYVFFKRDGPIWYDWGKDGPGYLADPGIAVVGTPHAMIQVAHFMGFDRYLLVGMDNTGDEAIHFYPQETEGDPWRKVDPALWDWGFALLRDCLIPNVILNLSTQTTIKSLPRADWRNFA